MYIIAEIGINHNGDIEIAKDLINMAYGCGADAVKFQKRTITEVYTKEFLSSPRVTEPGAMLKLPNGGTTQGHQKEALEFGWEEYDTIDHHCKILGIDWFGSAWDLESLHFLNSYSPPYHKIASAMLTNRQFLLHVASCRRPVILSTGMSTIKEILKAVRIFRDANIELVVMHCVSVYPCEDEDCNVRNIEHLAGMLPGVKIGYSGHERGIQPTLAAVALGAEYIERHITLDRSMYGSDQSASLERRGLCRIIEYAKQIEKALGKPGRCNVSDKELAVAKKLRTGPFWEGHSVV